MSRWTRRRSTPASGVRPLASPASLFALAALLLAGLLFACASSVRAQEAPEAGPAVGPVPAAPYRCRQPALAIPRAPACARDAVYPRCRWQIPEPPAQGGAYRIWRNTTPEHRWGRPGLVSLVLAATAEHLRRWPGHRMSVGDLDAPGPRHVTHRRGRDVDLYLEHAMMARNLPGNQFPSNYEGRSAAEVGRMRAEVSDLARLLATCAGGRIRILYNDLPVVHGFRDWFRAAGLSSPFGRPMRTHNPLHRFHFHLTVPADLAPLPQEGSSASARRSRGRPGSAPSGPP